MSTTIKLKRNETNASKSSSTEVLAQGEPAFDKVDGALYIGDGESTIAELNTAKKYFVQRTNGSVVSDMIVDNAVITSKILDENVISAKLASNAVTTGKIASGSVTTGKIAGGAVTVAKLNGASFPAGVTVTDSVDDYVNAKIDARIESGIQISASELVITEQSGDVTKDVIRAVRTDGAEPISTGTATIGGFTVHYNGLTGDNTTGIISTKISSASASPKFEINANTTGSAFLIAKNSSNSTVTSISSGGILSATDPIIKIGSTSGNIITTGANGQLQSSSTISLSKVQAGSTDVGKIVSVASGGTLTTTSTIPASAVPNISGAKITSGVIPDTVSIEISGNSGDIVTVNSQNMLSASSTINGSKITNGSIALSKISAGSGNLNKILTVSATSTNDTVSWKSLTFADGTTQILSKSKLYIPTSGGTSGYILKSNGSSTTAPEWVSPSSITAGTSTNANKIRINVNGTNGYYSATLTGSTLSFA